jgi:hypothetical protein
MAQKDSVSSRLKLTHYAEAEGEAMTAQQVTGFSALVIAVVGMLVYRVMWFIRREKRRNSGVVWFKTREPK